MIEESNYYRQLIGEGFSEEEAKKMVVEMVEWTDAFIEEYGQSLSEERKEELRAEVYESYKPTHTT